MRPNNRENNQPRSIKITRNYTKHAEGSVLVEFGDTKVLCTATVEDTVPRFLKGQGQGWVTAEYGMLPRSTHSRMQREAAKGKQGGRTMEIQRLIARSLRAMVDSLKNQLGSAVVVFASALDEKVNLIVGVTQDLTAKVKAGELVNLMAQQVGGKGGGRPDMAMAGGTEPQNINKALSVCSDWLKANL